MEEETNGIVTKCMEQNPHPNNSWSRTVRRVPKKEGFDLNPIEPSETNLKISMNDIKEEVNFWQNAVI